jgi:hypothetical protein
MGEPFIGLDAFQWVALVVAALALLLSGDALAGHYRSGFTLRWQYAPFISGGMLLVSALGGAIVPGTTFATTALRAAGWLAVATGGVGFALHHYYGISRKPGGYRWILHYLMYGAPQLAPLAFACVGALALVAARGLDGKSAVAGLRPGGALLLLVAVALFGAVIQAGILHYRGAFNNPLMYAPLTAPLLAAPVCLWVAFAPSGAASLAASVLLWLTFLIGFVGLGMHLRGFGRQMGGLYVALFNWLEGPPAFAPALFTGFAAVGLIAVHLM